MGACQEPARRDFVVRVAVRANRFVSGSGGDKPCHGMGFDGTTGSPKRTAGRVVRRFLRARQARIGGDSAARLAIVHLEVAEIDLGVSFAVVARLVVDLGPALDSAVETAV